MDEYKEYLYKRRPQYRNLEVGDLSAQLEIRERLKCKPFKWFMKEIAFDLPKKYPPIEPPDFASGEVSSILLYLHLFIISHFQPSSYIIRFEAKPTLRYASIPSSKRKMSASA